MIKLPKLAIVGRPNVGKSALFNKICKKKIAIVDEAEGITRDRLYTTTEVFGFPFELIDTGGIDPRSQALFNDSVKRQAEIAIEEADSLVMVVDAHIGITELDAELAHILLKTKKPVCLAVNKIDSPSQEHLLHPFYQLGIKRVVGVSAEQNWHIAELLEMAFADFTRTLSELEVSTDIKIAIVGRPNVGKSSLINYLLDEERCIVSPIPGTTRDSIDVTVIVGDQQYTLIDTAGIRRKHAEHEVVDKFAAIRTQRAIERADVCILMLDAQSGMTTQEKRIANSIEAAGKSCIVLFNKWDLVKGFRMEHCLKGIDETVSFMKHCPKLFTSVLTGRNIDQIFDVINEVSSESKKRITTHQLNKFITTAMQKNHPPVILGKRLRIYYMAQVGIQPPKFVLFVNYPNLMVESYRKYLFNQFREIYGFTGSPILMYMKGKKKKTREERGAVHADANANAHSKPEPVEVDEDEDMDEAVFLAEEFDDGELLMDDI